MSRPCFGALMAGLVAVAIAQIDAGAPPRTARANGTIRGRVELRQAPADNAPRVSVADLGMGNMHEPPDRRSVVYLDPAPRAAFERADETRPRMDQVKETFVPHVLPIVVGTTVDFPNNDHTYHNVFSLSKTKTFDLGRYAAGRSKAIRFDRPGIVRVFCDIHSHMSAFILVFGHPFFAMTDPDGRYRLDNVPPGTYSVVAWNEGTASDPVPIAVPSGGTAELDLVVR